MLQPKITVIGSINIDLVTEADRFPKPGETLLGKGFSRCMGGKGANQAIAAARLGAEVTIIGAVGDDAFAPELIANLKNEGINTKHVQVIPKQNSGIANITVAENDNHIIVISGANFAINETDIEAAEECIANADIVLCQLEIPLNCVMKAAKLAHKHHKILILNPAPAQKLPTELLELTTLLTPNAHELAMSLGLAADTPLEEMIKAAPCPVLVTVGSRGAIYNDQQGQLHQQSSFKVTAVDTTGAGDTFNGTLAVFWQHGMAEAVKYANAASALAITKLGAQAAMPTLSELQKFLAQQ